LKNANVFRKLLLSFLIAGWAAVFFVVSAFISEEVIGEDKSAAPDVSKKIDTTVSLSLELENTVYSLGEPVLMSFAVINESPNEPARLSFSSAQRYDFIVQRDGKEIWRWSRGRVFAMLAAEIPIEPGESLTFTESWDQRDNQKGFILPGKYEILGMLNTYPEIVSSPATIEIRNQP